MERGLLRPGVRSFRAKTSEDEDTQFGTNCATEQKDPVTNDGVLES